MLVLQLQPYFPKSLHVFSQDTERWEHSSARGGNAAVTITKRLHVRGGKNGPRSVTGHRATRRGTGSVIIRKSSSSRQEEMGQAPPPSRHSVPSGRTEQTKRARHYPNVTQFAVEGEISGPGTGRTSWPYGIVRAPTLPRIIVSNVTDLDISRGWRLLSPRIRWN